MGRLRGASLLGEETARLGGGIRGCERRKSGRVCARVSTMHGVRLRLDDGVVLHFETDL